VSDGEQVHRSALGVDIRAPPVGDATNHPADVMRTPECSTVVLIVEARNRRGRADSSPIRGCDSPVSHCHVSSEATQPQAAPALPRASRSLGGLRRSGPDCRCHWKRLSPWGASTRVLRQARSGALRSLALAGWPVRKSGWMDLGLRDRVYLVTGGSRGLGFAAAEALLGEGARVVISAPRENTVAAAAARLSAGIGAPDAAAPLSRITATPALRTG
jgi:short chain dehydrogenase